MDAEYTAYREMKIAENRKRRMKIVRRQRIALVIIISLVIAAATFLSVTFLSKASSEDVRFKYYTSVNVCGGDTLESISLKYISDEYKDMASYINEVRNINHLDEKDMIFAGENIIVPYFSSEFK